MNIREWCQEKRITATAERVDSNPTMEDGGDMDHWRVTLRRGKRRMVTHYSLGWGHNGRAPKAEEVLDCIASDAAGVENARDFSDWCADYGYSDDSRKAERIFRACAAEARQLRRWLGDGLYDDLLWHVERL